MATDIEVPGIAEIQVQQIKDPTNRAGSEEDSWFALWDILFPNRKRPFSPHLVVADIQEEFPQGIVSMTPGHVDLAEDESISTSSPLVNHRSPPQILEYASQRPVQPPAMVAHYVPTPVGSISHSMMEFG
ncbi:hypothetical protein EDB80DRAFT_877282 [Ilyonectria destructans]|nr:hypothetical protein EDB80DRAFT_877282 [Ilyonectria destructans]